MTTEDLRFGDLIQLRDGSIHEVPYCLQAPSREVAQPSGRLSPGYGHLRIDIGIRNDLTGTRDEYDIMKVYRRKANILDGYHLVWDREKKMYPFWEALKKIETGEETTFFKDDGTLKKAYKLSKSEEDPGLGYEIRVFYKGRETDEYAETLPTGGWYVDEE